MNDANLACTDSMYALSWGDVRAREEVWRLGTVGAAEGTMRAVAWEAEVAVVVGAASAGRRWGTSSKKGVRTPIARE